MSESEYKEKKKNQLKKLLKSNIILILLSIVSFIPIFILVILEKNYDFFALIFGGIFTLTIFFIPYSIIIYIINKSSLKKEYLIRNGQYTFKWPPYEMPINNFLENCKTGFFCSYIKVNNKIHIIDVSLDNINPPTIGKCHIDDTEFDKFEDFLNYEIEKDIAIKDLKFITILDTNDLDPKQVWVDKTL